jgi:voltage-gated potassium channel Kch
MCYYVQVVANMLMSPLTGEPLTWLAFSFNPDAVRAANSKGLPVFFGDGADPAVIASATSTPPRAFVLTHRSQPQLLSALETIRTTYPTVPVFALTIDVRRAAEVTRLGATAVVTRASAGVALGDAVLRGLMSTSYVDLVFLEQEMQLAVRDAVQSSAREGGAGSGMFILDVTPPPVQSNQQLRVLLALCVALAACGVW